ncbi:uncharacterized protein TRIADDRAFT_58198 [Trichoplax adhaerens]|uniref:Uncharacterized protein n=1 Tax=Trichoplax adhaerens TaxID=10228 RepID=B3S151_TRIAD|nr:hypothetical protein TRIADDRAFT_58198 [Trichoplax adhaerens]EDV23176.1 hypothetical protein TRIADDRAFT_58198 [Trichoplax adhaerens]|eukprot:XP_002114086.1 hypothetical protein TRIADDRAFT_58198 [Trichoplax adhaerens]
METGNKELILINNQRRKMAAQASNVKLPSLNRQRKYNDDSDDEAVPVTRFRPKNRKKIKPSQWKKLTDLEKSRYMAEAEMNHLIACQPTSLRAIRLQTLVPPRPKPTQFDDLLDKLERVRVENIIEDDRELTITRELTRAI